MSALHQPASAGQRRRASVQPLPSDHLERVWAWGMSASAMEYVYRPSTVEALRGVFEFAKKQGRKIALRGAGRSYGDASLLAEEIGLDLTRMRRILDWNPTTGIVRVEPGVTIRDLWQVAIEDGWWPPVVPGTMHPTIGGCASMNIHGKNNYRVGPIGDHIREFELMLPSGAIKRCNREQNADLFYAAIGGFGMLGCFTSITLALKRIYSGHLAVTPIATPNLGAMLSEMEARLDRADYLVGWIDCFAKAGSLGRGLIHQADHLREGADPSAAQSLRVENQELPETFMWGLAPRSIMWRLMKPMVNNPCMKAVNWVKYLSSLRQSGKTHTQSHAEFAFLLDYVPGWKRAYLPGGLIQYQSFIPAPEAERVFRGQLEVCHQNRLPAYLGVVKRHRADDFWMTHGLDGFSLALDFKVTRYNRERLWAMTAQMNKLVIEAGGRFYFAKDSTLSGDQLHSFLSEDRVKRFLDMKRRCDPDTMLQTELYKRVFGQPALR